MDADGPLVHYLGGSMVAATLFAFIITITAVTHEPSDAQKCIAAGGSWSHTLSQKQDANSYEHYDDACTMPGRP